MASAVGSMRFVDQWQRLEEKGVDVGAVQEIITTSGTTAGMICRNKELGKADETNFGLNFGAASRRIAQSIAVLFQETWISVMSSGPHTVKPTQVRPLKKEYPLAFTREIKSWMQDVAKAEPFCTWFEVLAKPAPEKETVGNMSSWGKHPLNPGEVDPGYFQKYMTRLGRLVNDEVTKCLTLYRETAGNHMCRFTVTWVDETPSTDKQSVEISAWLDEAWLDETLTPPQPNVQPVRPYSYPASCILS